MKLRFGRPDQFWISVASSFLVPSSSSPTTQPFGFPRCGDQRTHKVCVFVYYFKLLFSSPEQTASFVVRDSSPAARGVHATYNQIHQHQIRVYREIQPQLSPVLFFLAHRDLSPRPWPLLTTNHTHTLFRPIVRTIFGYPLSKTSTFTERVRRRHLPRPPSPTTHPSPRTTVGMSPRIGSVRLPTRDHLRNTHLLCLRHLSLQNPSTPRTKSNNSTSLQVCSFKRNHLLATQEVVLVPQPLEERSLRTRSGVHAPTQV